MTTVARKDNGVDVRRVTWVGLAWNVLLSVGKLLAGIWGGSQALVADAVHSISDFVTDIAVLVGSRYWNSPPDAEHPYGHRRFETLITIFIGLAVIGVGVGIGYNAIKNLIAGEESHPELIAAVMALVSVVVKEILFQYTRRAGRAIRSQALEANAWHHRSDAFSSIPVVIALVVAMLFPGLWFADAVGAIIVAGFVIFSGFEITWPGIHQVADKGADPATVEKLRTIALNHPAVISIHGFRTRYVGSDLHIDLHIVVDAQMTLRDAHDAAEEVEGLLINSGENIVDALVHIDPYDEEKAKK
ncbi:MAG: cation transporter [Fibrobacteraceae bacterium]|nr:cation transporter [Fibrobacteraceae bacterium]MCF0216827.1 cation transporter [Fibrobacteraceae bacterium]